MPEATAAPLDLDHLAAQTFGNRALEREVLAMFIAQSGRILAELATPGPARAERAHTLLGSARSLGAGAVAAAAEALENAVRAEPWGGDPQVVALTEAVEAANAFIAARLQAG